MLIAHSSPQNLLTCHLIYQKVVGTSNGTLFLSDVSTGKVLHSVTDRPSLASGAISPDGQIFAGGYENGVIKLWTLPTVQLLHTFVGYQSSVYALIFSADGHHIVSMGSDHKSDRGGYVRVSDPAATIKWWELDGLA